MRRTGCTVLSLVVTLVLGVIDRVPAADAPKDAKATETLANGWVATYEEARDEAKRLGKPLLIHFHATWCGPCRTMDASVLNTEPVLEQLKTRVVGVKIDSDQRPDLVSQFGISGLPSDVYVSPDSEVLAREGATYSPEDYRSRIVLVANRYHGSRLTQLIAALKQAEKDAGRKDGIAETANAVIQAGSVEPEDAVDESLESIASLESADENEPVEAVKPVAKAESSLEPGMKGYSPVAILANQRWIRGEKQYSCQHNGIEYYLASAAELEKFKADADHFAPAWAGLDPLALSLHGEAKPGSVRYAAYFRNRVYLFASDEHRRKFVERPSDFEHVIDAMN